MGQDPPARRAHHALGQRACDTRYGDQRLAHLQRLPLFPVPDPKRTHPRRLAGGRPAMAFRRHVAAGAEPHRLRNPRHPLPPLPEEDAAADAATATPRPAWSATPLTYSATTLP